MRNVPESFEELSVAGQEGWRGNTGIFKEVDLEASKCHPCSEQSPFTSLVPLRGAWMVGPQG